MRKYKIYMMSARNIISYAEKDSDGIYKFNLQARETEKCKVPTASHEQESNALFHQIMCQLHGDNFEIPEDINLITDLENVIFYIDFAGIFVPKSSAPYFANVSRRIFSSTSTNSFTPS